MAWSCESSMDGICWILALVVVAVLVYLGCSELRKTSSYAAARRATAAPVASARSATTDTPDAAAKSAPDAAPNPPPRRSLTGISGTDINEAFAELDVDRSMTRVVPESTYQVPDSMFLQEFNGADQSSFRPINKEAALKSANTRPAQQMANGRDNGVKSRTVGLYGMAFAGRGPIERPAGSSSCIAFGDTDTRQHHAMHAIDTSGDRPYQ